jgi:hypothetical protein
VSNLHVEKLKYSINKNYSNLILMNIKSLAYCCWMSGNFFWRPRDQQKSVNKKQNVEIDSNTSSQGKLYFPWPPLAAAPSILTLYFFVKNSF